MSEAQTKKDHTFWKVLNAALELEFKKGHLKWTMADLSRKSGITRSLIYYYFGRKKIDILKAAVKIIGEEFVGLSEERQEMWKQGEFEKSLTQARQFYEKAPHLCSFYLNDRGKPNEIGESLRDLEKTFKEKMRKFVPSADQSQLNTLFAVYFGISFSPNVGPKEIALFSRFIKSIFSDLKS